MIPIRAIIVGPSCSATSINACSRPRLSPRGVLKAAMHTRGW
jgi:hypothetical protein